MIRRRAVLGAFCGLAAAGTFRARANSRPVRRLALFVSFGAAAEPNVRAVAAKLLAGHGFEEGRNLSLTIVDYADRMADRERLARELVASAPDAILVMGSPDALLLQRLTRSLPVVFAGVGDPEGLGLVQSLARPGGNLTGASSRYGDLLGKRFELLKSVVPGLRRIALIVATGPAARLLEESSEAAARGLGLTVERIVMADDSRASVNAMLASLARVRVDGVVYAAVRSITFAPELLAALRRSGLPAVFSDHELVAMGGLMSLGEHDGDMYARAVALGARVLRGERPETLPVDQLTRPHLAINLKTARAMKIEVPSSIRLRADEVIE